jgi:GH25 family lysozyme M1 (1,4-beta-N-acetylmuramidase)
MKKQLLFISALAISSLPFGSRNGLKAQSVYGIDISSYQGSPNWTSVKADPKGYVFAYAKSSESISIADGSFVYNMTNGKAAGMKMGAYHFCNPVQNSAHSEVLYFLSIARKYISSCYMPPMLDVEDTPGESALSTMGGAALTAWVADWCQEVEDSTGIAPIIYTDGSYAALMQSAATKFKLWIATDSGNPATAPSTTGSWPTWIFNQYSWTGTVSGISGSVDLDVFNGNITAFDALVPCSPVQVNFTSNVQTGCAGMSVNFTDLTTSTGTLNAWRWDFQGGTPSSAKVQNPSGIVYNTPGTYYVKEVVNSTTGHDSVTVTGYIHVLSGTTQSLPLSETFQSATFPPTGWTLNFPVATDSAWQLATTVGYSSTQCMYFPANCGNVSNISGQRQQIYSPAYSFTGVTNAEMSFDVAYEPSSTTSGDTLAVYYSTDCGGTWHNIYLKGGGTLCTTGSTTGKGTDVVTESRGTCFVPPNTSAWRRDSINLSAINNQSNVMFSFESRSGWGNIIYVDNINVPSTLTAVQNISESNDVRIYPNPNNGSFSISITGDLNEKAEVEVFDMLGQQVYHAPVSIGVTQMNIDARAGIYFVRVMTESGSLISQGRLVVQH